MTATKPLVVIACPPETGHTNPLLIHATHLVKQGHEVHFLAGVESENAILRTGATFYPVQRAWRDEMILEMMAIPEGPERFIFGLKKVFVDLTPFAMKALQNVLEKLKEEQPDREVVIVQEFVSMGIWPFILGAPLPKGYTKLPKVITFSTAPVCMSSVDTAPFGPGLPPDSSGENRARNKAMYEASNGLWTGVNEYINAAYAKLGATSKTTGVMFDFWSRGTDLLVYPCSPSLEYPRSDLPLNVRFIGGSPRQEVSSSVTLPEWWEDILAAKQAQKKIVFVTQGTVILDYRMLLLPALEALADREYCIVVGVLGKKGAELKDVPLPANARIVDYLAYDAILPHTDVFVTNGGYGGFMQGVMQGSPMVLAGEGQDKAEVAMRGEWAGIAVNLRTATPTAEAIREGVDKILTDSKYKERILEIQRENERLNGPVQLERFYTCQKDPQQRCKFFLWASDAEAREKLALLSNSRTESSATPQTPSKTASAQQTTGLLTPATGQRDRYTEPSRTYQPPTSARANSAAKARMMSEDSDEFEWDGKIESEVLGELDNGRGSGALRQPDFGLPARKTPRTERVTSPGKRKRSFENADEESVTVTPGSATSQVAGASAARGVGAGIGNAPFLTPTPKRYRDAAGAIIPESPLASSVELAAQVSQILQGHGVVVPKAAQDELKELLKRHELKMKGVIQGRDISRNALKAKDEQIRSLNERITQLEAQRR
ncbi:hypothetical protein BJY04DRAFT_216881 [Aspergillus karnatakaensis]|uniref:uncharacterized protein n=1 Tax=Aspergillus karnatakaensis TaxID=1810916 RepID=UPI003CCD55F4